MAGSNESLPPVVEEFVAGLPESERAVIVGCIQYIREHPEPDGTKIFDIPIYPAMFRSMNCSGYVITFRMQDHEALIYAVVANGG